MGLTMATLKKKDLLKVLEEMPIDKEFNIWTIQIL
jgi:hypothetical protein